MNLPVLERLERWLGASIANRILAAALTVAMVALTLTGLMSYTFSRHLLQRQIEQEHAATAALLAQRIEWRLNQIGEEMRALAGNTLVVNALLDPVGRDDYLLPFLREFRTASLAPTAICLYDFRGEARACSQADNAVATTPAEWGRQVAEQNSHHAQWLPDGQGLLLALPVFHHATGQPEGMIVARFGLKQLFTDIFALAGERTVHVTTDGKTLWACARCTTSPTELLRTRTTPALAAPFDGLHLDLWVGAPRNDALAPSAA